MVQDDDSDEASALDLEISGAVGSFVVQPKLGNGSILVRYIQTHVRFPLDDSHQQRLFENLVPVREIFGAKDLGFEEIMQRDIDDARVSSSLIPYLLSVGRGEQVKFFPPIVAVAIPVSVDKQLLDCYPKVTEVPIRDAANVVVKRQIRSGTVGDEVFEFELREKLSKLKEFDNARLRLNTSKTRVVIVDGQHRAMALLALYRNMKSWPDQTAAFQGYYRRWSKDILRDNLQGISLPIVICVFPELDGESGRQTKVVQACRSVFLALNKNARPVSDARNILLDDYDAIAHFERRVLTQVKNISPASPSALRLWNFELDSDENKVQVTSTVAFSGVMPIYSMIERLLLLDEEVTGLNAPARKYGNVKNISDCLRRLDGPNLLGAEGARAVSRTTFTVEAIAKLADSFELRYGKHILRIFQQFWPFEAMAQAALNLETRLRNESDTQCHAMLFEGQGILRVCQSYMEAIESELKDKFPAGGAPAELTAVRDDFKATWDRLQKHQAAFARTRAANLLGEKEAKFADGKNAEAVRAVTLFYKETINTAAFQTALFNTVFLAMEKANSGRGGILYGDASDEALVSRFVAALNAWFKPTDDASVRKLASTFVGHATGSVGSGTLKVVESAKTLRRIVIPNELKPDEWGKFRYILLEIWSAGDVEIRPSVADTISACRADVAKSYFSRRLADYCEEENISLQDLDKSTKHKKAHLKILQECTDAYCDALNLLGAELSAPERQVIRDAMEKAHPTAVPPTVPDPQ